MPQEKEGDFLQFYFGFPMQFTRINLNFSPPPKTKKTIENMKNTQKSYCKKIIWISLNIHPTTHSNRVVGVDVV